MAHAQVAGQPGRAAIVQQGVDRGLPGVALQLATVFQLVATVEVAQAGADVQAAAQLIVAQGMQAQAPGLGVGGGVEAAVRVVFAVHADLAIETAHFTAGRLQGQPAPVMQAHHGLVLALQVVLHIARNRAARGGGGHQVGIGQLQHQAAEQARIVAQALVDAFLAEGVGQDRLVVFGGVVPGRAAGDRRVVGLGVAVQVAQFPVGGFDIQDRDIQRLEGFAITAATGAGGVLRVQAGVGEQVDVQLLGDLEGVLAQ